MTTNTQDINALRATVSDRYGEAARKVIDGTAAASCCGPATGSSGCCGATTESWDPITANLYDEGQAAGIPALACHAARAGRTAGAAYLRGQGAPADVVAEFSGQPPSPAIPFDRACSNGATAMAPDQNQPGAR